MPTIWDALEDRMSSVCDKIYGETWRVLPRLAGPGGGRSLVDGSRAEFEFTAIFEEPERKSTEFGSEARGSLPALMSSPMCAVDRRQFVGSGRYEPVQRDRLVRVSSGQSYEIAARAADQDGRAVFHLKKLSED